MNKAIFLMVFCLFASLSYAYNSTGGNMTYDGNYTVVTCLSNCTINITGTIQNASVLIVAGGGSGGARVGGGGGAGGLIYLNGNQTLSGNYTVIVGLGGTAVTQPSGNTGIAGNNGGNSSFGNFTAVGGGGGGAYSGLAPKSGGSGGGGTFNSVAGAAGTTGQGNSGGNGTTTAGSAPGGGGSSQPGANASTSNYGGGGGNGTLININGTAVYYAGGGGGSGDNGGGPGGLGGGGAGKTGDQTPGNSATANTGGGGGATRSSSDTVATTSGAGGSGIVIIRYLTYIPQGNLTVNSTVGGTAIGNNTTFVPPANLTINATANVGFMFSAWTITSGNCSVLNSSNANTQVLVNDTSICNAQANFFNYTPIVNSIQILNSSNGTIFVNGSVLYAWANVTALANSTPTIYYKWYLNNSLNTTGSIVASNNASVNIDIKLGAISGQSWKIEVIASDGTHNSTAVNSTAVNISDNIPPVLNITSPINTGMYSNSTGVLINFNATDNIGISALWFNNGTANVSYTTPVILFLPVGNYTFVFYANDTSNNIASQNVSFMVNLYLPGPLPNFGFNITPNPGNSSNTYTLNYNISLYGLGTYVRYRNWTSIIQNWTLNANSIVCSSAIGCNTALFADVMLTNGTTNSSIVTNKTLVYTLDQQNLPSLGETIEANYIIDYGALIVGLFIVAIAFIVSPLISGQLYGVNDRIISTTLIISGALYFIAFLVWSPHVVVFGYLVIPCIVLGFMARYWNI